MPHLDERRSRHLSSVWQVLARARTSSCDAALAEACGAKKSDVFACAECAGTHQHALKAAGCANDAIAAWCAGAAPSPAPPQQLAAFRGSRLITDTAWGRQLNTWAGMEGREWSLCCSTFEGCDTGAKFHAACDAHTPTLTVAHNTGGTNDKGEKNPGNFTFGGFVRSHSLFPLAGSDLSRLCVLAPFFRHSPARFFPLFDAFLPRFDWESVERRNSPLCWCPCRRFWAVGSALGPVGTASARR